MAGLDGQRLRLARKRRRLSRHQLADALGVEGSRIRDWELGKRVPAPKVVPVIADLLLITPDTLLRRNRPGGWDSGKPRRVGQVRRHRR